ncbi:MAG TPA: prolyl oligopeptidase family serine peptidase [Solirubrobacteraceae bacterium]
MADSFPRQKARTRNFSLGAPRSFQVAADGSRVVFLRSPAGDDPRTALWVFDVAAERERLVADPTELAGGSGEEPSVEERARRERARETAGGIVAYAVDRNARIAALVLFGRLFVADLVDGGVRELDVPVPVFDPRPDPPGEQIAFVHARALHVVRLADGLVTRLAGEDQETVSWGVAEFVAAEEMQRERGYWWSPGGEALLAARVDEAPVRQLWITDAADPGSPPRSVRYPTAGSANALVKAHVIRPDGAPPVEVVWDRAAYPYLAAAHWDEHGPMVVVQSRDQRRLAVLTVDPRNGETASLSVQADDHWVDLFAGVPRRLSDGRLVTVAGVDDALALLIGDRPVTPPEMEVRSVLAAGGEEVLFTASTDPTEVGVWRWESGTGRLTCLTPTPGVHTAASDGGVQVIGSAGMEHDGIRWALGGHVFRSRAAQPTLTPSVELLTVGETELRVGLVLPRDHPRDSQLPVLMDPYGGPHFQRVVAARERWLESQWLADHGFAVIVADGRGTPGRGRAWARAVAGDLAGPVLDDQVTALREVAAKRPYLDLTRVAIRGWSFGGYLAALAVLRRPEIFHVAVAGAPVTEWRLYDTHYTERYLGVDPDGADRAAYDGSSLLHDAARLRRPLLLIHGLADDNVVAAHTLQLSQRLTESGRLHAVLPLTGITHMTPQEAVAEHMLTIQLDFIRQALGDSGTQ